MIFLPKSSASRGGTTEIKQFSSVARVVRINEIKEVARIVEKL